MLDLTDPEIDQTQFPTEDWSETPHGPYKEGAFSHSPAPRGT